MSLIKADDLKTIKKEVYPNTVLLEVFTDSTGGVCVMLCHKVGPCQWDTAVEDWSGLVDPYPENTVLWNSCIR